MLLVTDFGLDGSDRPEFLIKEPLCSLCEAIAILRATDGLQLLILLWSPLQPTLVS